MGESKPQCRTTAGSPATFCVPACSVWIGGWKIATLSLVFNVTHVHASPSISHVPPAPPAASITAVMFDIGNVRLHVNHRLIAVNMHVHAATELGIHAYHYVSNAGVRDILALHGVPTSAAQVRVA